MSHPPVSPFSLFSPLSLRPGVVGVCFQVSGWNVMPERLLFVISGILAGGIPGFCTELCCFLHPLTWPLVILLWFFVLLLVRSHSHHDTQDVIMHESPLLVAIPLLGVFWLFWFCFVCWFLLLVCCFFCFCLFAFVVWFVFLVFLLGLHTGLRTGPLPILLWLSTN